ncbi:hypothetical protein F5I97DRAFT_213121 [Phlebopus sp. FC_14]|nr:hypothetical protein F5I97DRAFT_213121 [Phlebopus sp. FC_14]
MSASQIIPNGTPMLSPISPSDAPWDHHQSSYSSGTFDALGWSYYTLPPSPPTSDSSNATDSPIPTSQILQSLCPPDSFCETEFHQCMPTHQPSFSSGPAHPAKRPFTSVVGIAKKPRGSGERITTKDFIPPDVSGLSKREARLVKNRAAAFLSRQRKREEFEAMEIRVKELEEENARLSVIAEKGSTQSDLLSEINQLRLRLLAAEKRERELSVELSRNPFTAVSVKTEIQDNVPVAPRSPSASRTQPSTQALGLMALRCALPSLLSIPSQSPLPVTVSVPLRSSTTARTSTPNCGHGPLSAGEPERRHCAQGGSGITLDTANVEALERLPETGTEVSSGSLVLSAETLCALGGLEISFDGSSAEEGRIKVHIRSSERHAGASTGASVGVKTSDRTPSSSLAAWLGPEANAMGKPFAQHPFASAPPLAPSNAPSSPNHIDQLRHFLESGGSHAHLGLEAPMTASTYSSGGHDIQDQLFGHYTGYLEPFMEDPARLRGRAGRRGTPHLNGGEWEVQVC